MVQAGPCPRSWRRDRSRARRVAAYRGLRPRSIRHGRACGGQSMTSDPSEALELLQSLDNPAAMAPGVVMSDLRGVGIFFSPDDLARNRWLRTMKWPRLRQGHPDAIAEWSRRALECEAMQKALVQPIATAEPESKAGSAPISRTLKVRR